MRTIYTTVTRGKEESLQREYVYEPEELPLLDLMLRCRNSTSRPRKRPGTNSYYKIQYLEIPCAFDIETTNIYTRKEDGKIATEPRPYAYMYHWQLSIGGYVTFGRTWEEWQHALDVISERMHLSHDTRLVIYCHNLPFEFQFFRRFVTVTEGFYKDPYKPLKVAIAGGIEFRDSLALSNMNLAAFCKASPGCIHYKADGDLDYSKIRTAATPLTMEELGYCYNDVAGLTECIAARMRDDTLASMPMTSTGYVRRDARTEMKKNRNNRRCFLETALTPELYRMHRLAFRGGNTHANAAMAGRTILGRIYSYDITSSYPAVMMLEYYPMSRWSPYSWETQQKLDPGMDLHCYIFEILLDDPEYIGTCGIPYISTSKCTHITEGDNYQEDNGRLRRAAYAEMTITEVDWKIIKDTYKFKHYYIRNMYAAKRGPLPAEFKSVIMRYFAKKTELKGSEDPESKYMYDKYKALLNALYGLSVMRIDMDTVLYDPARDPEYYAEGIGTEELLDKFYKSRNNYLPYQWGLYVTCHARARLERMLQTIGPDVIYCDTDSIKCIGDHTADFDLVNKELQSAAEAIGAYAYNKDGKKYYLGTWDLEYTMTQFKTLGAKKYMYERDGKIYTTIAGVNKSRGAAFFKDRGFDAFKDGTVIKNSGHLVAYRNNDTIHKIRIKGCEMTTASNLALVDDTYTMGITPSYLELLKSLVNGILYTNKEDYKMSFSNKYNKGSKFNISTEGFEYCKISEVVDDNGLDPVYAVAALFVNTKGKFDDHPVVVLPEIEALVDLPSHMTETVRQILADPEAVADIVAGKVGIQFERYTSKTYNRECIGCRWVDIA